MYDNKFQQLAADGTVTQFFDHDKFRDYADEFCEEVSAGSKDTELPDKCIRWAKQIAKKRRRYLQNEMDPEKRKQFMIVNYNRNLTFTLLAHRGEGA